MQPIERALAEIRALHEQITDSPAPEIPSNSLMSFPPGADPVTYAIEEVEALKQVIGERTSGTGGPETRLPPRSEPAWSPPATVLGSEDAFRILIEIPGAAAEDVALTMEEGHLVLRGVRQPPDRKNLQPMLIEQAFGGFERRFALPPWLQPQGIRARCHNGILEVEACKEVPHERT